MERTGFVPVVRLHETYHRLPTGLDEAEEKRLATRAVARLRAVGYHVEADDAFDTDLREAHYLPLGSQIAHLAEQIRQATTTDEVAGALTELTAAHDGVLIALGEVLAATAEFYQDLGQPPDPYIAKRLRYLAEHRLGVIRSDLAHLRGDLADRHQDHPQRRACTGGVGPDEREASAVCACPPPPATPLRRPQHRPRLAEHSGSAALNRPFRPEETMHDPTPDTGLGSFATVLAGELPGTWTSRYHPDRGGDNDHDALTDEVWDMNEVAAALAKHTVDRCAVLTRTDGTRLFVVDPVGHGEGYLIAALAPQDAPVEAFRGVREPDGIAVADGPFTAVEDITYDLLPRYDKALAQVRHNTARLAAPSAAEPERVVMTWSGDDLVVEALERPEIAQTLTDHGFAFDATRHVFVLSGDDSARQGACVRAAGHRLSALGIGVVLRHPPARPALGTTALAPPAPPATSAHRTR
ncbi:hypothetical protein [Streptomyces silvisoli]|uniref:Uncharacterized protein n=1 Tax=Streptomyces silvisoli TaxID=3034235 RepID=A0ABT5ZRQ9_9ACTN|nr:hypothetical protein [Streptomyces silvisoli]MDF3292406.1 hypothetical protein [Streptomyces silvisoli]